VGASIKNALARTVPDAGLLEGEKDCDNLTLHKSHAWCLGTAEIESKRSTVVEK